MSKSPAQQPKWNIYESSLLLETYLKCKNLNSVARKPYLEELSHNLRKIAVNKGLTIDETYRNFNGMTLQMGAMECLFTGKQTFKPSKMFIKTYKMYMNNRSAFYIILSDAYRMIDNTFDFTSLENMSREYNLFVQDYDFTLSPADIDRLIVSKDFRPTKKGTLF